MKETVLFFDAGGEDQSYEMKSGSKWPNDPLLMTGGIILLILGISFSLLYDNSAIMLFQVTMISSVLLILSVLDGDTDKVRRFRMAVLVSFAVFYAGSFGLGFLSAAVFSEGFISGRLNPAIYLTSTVLLAVNIYYVFPHLFSLLKKERNSTNDFVVNLTAVSVLLLLILVTKSVDCFLVRYPSGLDLMTPGSYFVAIGLFFYFVKNLLHYYMNPPGISADRVSPENLSLEDKDLTAEDQELAERAKSLEKALLEDDLYLNPVLSLDLLAEHTRIPKHQLSNLFSQYFEENFYQKIGRLRVAHAMELLEKDARIPMDHLVEECGFNSKSTFYKYFREIYGCTPSEYRNTILRKGLA